MHGRMESDTKRDFGVLYTHQKTKKSKTWQDGFLRLSAQGTRAILLDEKGSKLDALHVKPDQVSVGEELESDRYLITIEEEKATQALACSSEVHQQQEQQQQQQRQQQQYQQQQPAFGSQKRIPLKRKRTGFTVPRQASKKLATDDASLTSTSVSHTPSSVVDHTDPVTKPTLFSTPFARAGESKNFRTNFLNAYDGGMQASTSANVATCVSMDGKNPSTWDPHYPSDLSGKTVQENQIPVTSGGDDSFAPPCFDVGTPQVNPTHTSTVCSVETNNLHHSFGPDNQLTENGRMGRHESEEVEQLKENIPNFNLTDEHSMQKSKTIPLKENVPEANNERNSAGRRSTSQILALLGNGKAKFKPPVKQPELESDIEVAPKTLPIPASDIQVAISPKVHFQASKPSFPAPTFSEDEDVMTLLGQAKAESTAVSCIDPPRDALHPGTDNSEPSLIFNRQGKTEMTQDESPAISVEQAMYPESMENGASCENSTEVQITKAAVGRASTFQSLPTPHSGRSGRGFQTPTMTVSGQTALSSGRSICGDLFFPSVDEIQGVASLQRQVQIPASFSCVAHYKQVLTSALKEHLNIILFELSQRYHSAKDKADVQHLDSSLQQSGDQSGASASPRCDHGNPAKMVCVKKEGANKGRFFYACSAQRANQCKFFMWADKFKGSATNSDSKSSGSSRPSLTDPTAATMYFRSHNIKLYYGCELQKRSNYSNLMPGAPAWIRKHKQKMMDNSKKKLYLKLSRKESSSSYGKEDIWVISKDLTFDPRSTFLARSVYHGPSSNNDVEIEPLYGYSTSNWTSSCTVHALLACNASSELTCLNNIQEYVNARSVPILPFLLGNRCDEAQSVAKSRLSAFKPPAHQACSNYRSLGCSAQDIEQIATGMIERHHLNTDQAAALRRVALMFQQASSENANPEPVTLIHGVFGAGKSFLLAVTVLFLLQVFELSDALLPGDASQQLPWKLLIASTTNVAVDRILLGLLQLGFEDFIRVGSIKKIAKPVLPYSVHASDKKDSQEIRDLYEMLKTDLTPTEKHHIRRSIERQRLGRNKDLLGSVRVVGVTCAACTFPCMSSLKFPVILLDECSQMTEPSSLLPIARFQCEKLVLVGDPKQLDPTIQGSEAAHRHGLEQTLFNRLILLGCEPILLRTQYRCHPTISAIANCLFYDQQLIDGVSAQDRPPLAPIPTLCFYSVSSGKECCASDGSYYNDQEAAFVIFLIETLVLLGVEPADIGVITLYKAQTVKINVLLQASKLSTQNSLKAIQISTVDAFQGGEKGVIILSCVRTDYMGFADSDKRTNVALTRSKNHLLIVGNLRILSANSLWGKVIDQCKGAENGIQFSQAFIKHWTPRLEELANQEKNKDQTGSKATPPESSPNFSPASEMEDSTAKVQLPSPHDRSPSYSPLSAVEESEGDTSLKANEQMPCFDIGDMQDLLE